MRHTRASGRTCASAAAASFAAASSLASSSARPIAARTRSSTPAATSSNHGPRCSSSAARRSDACMRAAPSAASDSRARVRNTRLSAVSRAMALECFGGRGARLERGSGLAPAAGVGACGCPCGRSACLHKTNTPPAHVLVPLPRLALRGRLVPHALQRRLGRAGGLARVPRRLAQRVALGRELADVALRLGRAEHRAPRVRLPAVPRAAMKRPGHRLPQHRNGNSSCWTAPERRVPGLQQAPNHRPVASHAHLWSSVARSARRSASAASARSPAASASRSAARRPASAARSCAVAASRSAAACSRRDISSRWLAPADAALCSHRWEAASSSLSSEARDCVAAEARGSGECAALRAMQLLL